MDLYMPQETRTQQAGTGWSNLYGHIVADDPDKLTLLSHASEKSHASLDSFILPVTKEAQLSGSSWTTILSVLSTKNKPEFSPIWIVLVSTEII